MGFQLKAFAVTLLLFVFNSAVGQTVAGYKAELTECKTKSGISTSLVPLVSDGEYTYYFSREQKFKTKDVMEYISKRDSDLNEVLKGTHLSKDMNPSLNGKYKGLLNVVTASLSDDQSTLSIYLMIYQYSGHDFPYTDNLYANGILASIYLARYNTKDLSLVSFDEVIELPSLNERDKYGTSSLIDYNENEGWLATLIIEDGKVSYKRYDSNGKVEASKGFNSPDGVDMVVDKLAHTEKGYVYVLTRSKKYGSVLFSFDPFDDSDIKVNDLGLNTGKTYSNPYFIPTINNSLYLVGTYAEKDLEKSSGYYVIGLSPDRNYTKKLEELPYDNAMLTFLETGYRGKKVKNGEAYQLEITDVIESEGTLYITSAVQWETASSSGSVRVNMCETTVSRIDLKASSLKMKSTGFMQRYMGMNTQVFDHVTWVRNGTFYLLRYDQERNLNQDEFRDLAMTHSSDQEGVGLVLTVVPESGSVKSTMLPNTIGKGLSFMNLRSVPGAKATELTMYSGNFQQFYVEGVKCYSLNISER